MSTYQATVERDGRFWLIRIADVGATQARHLREVEEMARDLIVNLNDVQPEQVEVSWSVVLPKPVRRHLDEAARLRQEAAVTLSDAAAELRHAARELKAAGLPFELSGWRLECPISVLTSWCQAEQGGSHREVHRFAGHS